MIPPAQLNATDRDIVQGVIDIRREYANRIKGKADTGRTAERGHESERDCTNYFAQPGKQHDDVRRGNPSGRDPQEPGGRNDVRHARDQINQRKNEPQDIAHFSS